MKKYVSFSTRYDVIATNAILQPQHYHLSNAEQQWLLWHPFSFTKFKVVCTWSCQHLKILNPYCENYPDFIFIRRDQKKCWWQPVTWSSVLNISQRTSNFQMSLSWFWIILHDDGSVLMATGGRKCARTCAWRCATSGSSLSSVLIACAKWTMPGDKCQLSFENPLLDSFETGSNVTA